MSGTLFIPVSIAEIFDKISILEIKIEELKDPQKLRHVEFELSALMEIARENDLLRFFDDELYLELKSINHKLWHICDIRRKQESDKEFGEEFIKESRNEYLTNDSRALIKRQINKKLNSEVIEVKSYE